ncbi:MAG: hypothetical protein KAI43_05880 [Candidatus Aureabacteria bacterium]|nr:hypothetical protein [Candidatus Auribacterota bacterium]
MKLFKHSIKTKGLTNFLKRFFTISSRFGLTPLKYIRYLKRFQELQEEFSLKTSFPITSTVLEKHKDFIKDFNDSFLFMLHGMNHIDYTRINKEKIPMHIRKGKKTLSYLGIEKDFGFRAPYLRYNSDVRDKLIEEECFFDSSRTVFVDDPALSIPKNDMDIINNLYSPISFDIKLSLPFFDHSLIEIPVTLPDDEIVIDRLHIRNKEKLINIFENVAKKIFSHQEIFIMQLHPERIDFLFEPLKNILKNITSDQNIWMTDLKTLAKWFKKVANAKYNFDINKKEIAFESIPEREIIGKNIDFTHKNGRIIYNSDTIPAIYLKKEIDIRFQKQLEYDGFFVLRSDDMAQFCSIVFSDDTTFSAGAYRNFRKKILSTEKPLVFLSRWPHDKKGVFCLSGDIDALTIGDFFSRFKHFSGTQ